MYELGGLVSWKYRSHFQEGCGFKLIIRRVQLIQVYLNASIRQRHHYTPAAFFSRYNGPPKTHRDLASGV